MMKRLKLTLLTLVTTFLIMGCGSSTTTAAAVTGEALPGRVEVL